MGVKSAQDSCRKKIFLSPRCPNRLNRRDSRLRSQNYLRSPNSAVLAGEPCRVTEALELHRVSPKAWWSETERYLLERLHQRRPAQFQNEILRLSRN